MQGVGAYSLGPLSLLIYEGKITFLKALDAQLLSEANHLLVYEKIIKEGSLELIKPFKFTNDFHSNKIMNLLLRAALRRGQDSIVKYLLSMDPEIFNTGYIYTVKLGKILLEVLEDEGTIPYTSKGLSLIFQFLLEQEEAFYRISELSMEEILALIAERAAAKGNLILLKQVSNLNPHINPQTLIRGVESKNLEVVKFLLSKGLDPNEEGVLEAAAKSESLEVVKELLAHGAQASKSGLIGSTYSKNIKIAKELIAHGAIPDQEVLEAALESSVPEIGIYFQELFPYNQEVYNLLFEQLIKAGRLSSLLQFYLKGYIQIDIRLLYPLEGNFCLSMARFLISVGFDPDFFGDMLLDSKRPNEVKFRLLSSQSKEDKAKAFYRSLYISALIKQI